MGINTREQEVGRGRKGEGERERERIFPFPTCSMFNKLNPSDGVHV